MWARTELCALIAVLAFAVGGCATRPPAHTTMLVHQQQSSVSRLQCVPCADQTREIERLRLEVARRDAEVRELRSNERVQVKVLLESKREVTRAKVKLRRLATRADTASYIAEVEVAMDALRSSLGARSVVPEVVAAQRLLDSTAVPFARGDYGTAMDRAAEAEQLIAQAADHQTRPRLRAASPPTATITGNQRGRSIGMARAKKDA